jgi:meiotically up-regulated gene 157 (Mug157) protein
VQNLYYAPKAFEELYKALGCSNFSDCVSESYHGTISVNEERRSHVIRHNIRAKVLRRLSMFLARYKEKERHERYQEMKNDLAVVVYDHIKVVKNLGPSQKMIDFPWKGKDVTRKMVRNPVKAD